MNLYELDLKNEKINHFQSINFSFFVTAPIVIARKENRKQNAHSIIIFFRLKSLVNCGNSS